MDVFRYLPVPLLLLVLAVGVAAAGAAALPGLRRRDRRAAAVASSRVLLAGALAGILVITQVESYVSSGGGHVNLVPLASILNQLDNPNRGLAIANIVGNALLFTPVGLLLPLALGWCWRRSAAAVVVLVVGVELLQLVTGRSADIDDVILNSLGGLLAAVPGTWLAARAERSRSPVRRTGSTSAV